MLHVLNLALAIAATCADPGDGWPSFRGPNARGVDEGPPTPVEWDVPEGRGVLWRSSVPGLAHSSPVVFGSRVFVTTAVRTEAEAELSSLFGSPGYGAGDPVEDEGVHGFLVSCYDAASGEELWTSVAHEGVPKVKRHPKSTHANSTPACNAEVVVAFFGSEGLYCYDLAGELRWKRDLGVLNAGAPGMPQYEWGFASSPVIHGDRVLVQCDVQGDSFLAALDLATGEDVWRAPRDEDPTWSTPAVAPRGDGRQVIANGYKRLAGYDLETGAELWWLSGGGDVPVPTPLVVGDLVYLTSAHGRSAPLTALRLDGVGELSRDPEECEHAVWNHPRRGVYMQTPIVYRDLLYACSDAGALGCYDPLTGEEYWRERVGDGRTGFSASPVGADGKLYLTGEMGEVFVVRAGGDFELLATNPLGEICLATPAASGGVLFFRTRGHLVAVGLD